MINKSQFLQQVALSNPDSSHSFEHAKKYCTDDVEAYLRRDTSDYGLEKLIATALGMPIKPGKDLNLTKIDPDLERLRQAKRQSLSGYLEATDAQTDTLRAQYAERPDVRSSAETAHINLERLWESLQVKLAAIKTTHEQTVRASFTPDELDRLATVNRKPSADSIAKAGRLWDERADQENLAWKNYHDEGGLVLEQWRSATPDVDEKLSATILETGTRLRAEYQVEETARAYVVALQDTLIAIYNTASA